MSDHDAISYLEIPSRDLAATKRFFSSAFGFRFTDYGPEYTAFEGPPLDGGFFKSEVVAQTVNGSALIVFLSNDLEASLHTVTTHGGEIVQDIFDFPGGRRFHFREPGGSEFAVWATAEGEIQ